MLKPFCRSPGIASLGIGFAMLVVSCGKDALPPIGPTPAQLTPY